MSRFASFLVAVGGWYGIILPMIGYKNEDYWKMDELSEVTK